MQDGYREKAMIATKLPVWMVKEEADFRSNVPNEQLEKLQTDYVDFYLLHALNKDRWNTVEDCHLLKKMKEAKDDGQIVLPVFHSMMIWKHSKKLWIFMIGLLPDSV